MVIRVFPEDGMTAPRRALLKSYSARTVTVLLARAGLSSGTPSLGRVEVERHLLLCIYYAYTQAFAIRADAVPSESDGISCQATTSLLPVGAQGAPGPVCSTLHRLTSSPSHEHIESARPRACRRRRHRRPGRSAGARAAGLRCQGSGAIARDRRDRCRGSTRAECLCGVRCAGHRRARPGARRLHRRAGDARCHRRDIGRPNPGGCRVSHAVRQSLCGHPSRRLASVAVRRRAGHRAHRVRHLDPGRAHRAGR